MSRRYCTPSAAPGISLTRVRPPRRRPQAAAFRGALWITLIAVITTVVALSVQHFQTVRVLKTELEHLLEGEADALVLRYRDGGVGGLATYIDEQTRTQRRDVVYMVSDRAGRRLAGNILVWPNGLAAEHLAITTVRVQRGGQVQSRRIEAEVRALGPDTRLLVGHLADSRIALGRRYWISLALSVLATAVLGLSLGWLVSRRGVRVVRAAADTGDRFLSGHLDERLKVSPRDDEFDRLAEVFNACLDEIERMVRSLRAATDGLAHDLKTPLTRIKARLELAALRGHEAPQQDILAETARDLDALLALVNGLLVLARADATTADSFVALDLAAVAQEAYDLYAPLAEDAGQHLLLRLSPAPARGVSSLLLHATANLIDNAIKHGNPGGQIVVATGIDGAASSLTIGDRGPGIAPDARERAVQRFSRLDESRSTPGSGLGLSLVATVARVHRGHLVLADNQPGLRAELRLPLSPGRDLRPAREAKEVNGETGRVIGAEG